MFLETEYSLSEVSDNLALDINDICWWYSVE